MSRLNVRIEGRVQGVGYRYFVMRKAQEHKLGGWVKNRSDGTVEIEAVGARPILEEFLSYVRVGPAAAHVSNAHVAWHEDEPSYATFDVKF